jgi:hypothetical protein
MLDLRQVDERARDLQPLLCRCRYNPAKKKNQDLAEEQGRMKNKHNSRPMTFTACFPSLTVYTTPQVSISTLRPTMDGMLTVHRVEINDRRELAQRHPVPIAEPRLYPQPTRKPSSSGVIPAAHPHTYLRTRSA